MKSIFRVEYQRLVEGLIQARKKSGLTQADLAERLRKPQSYVAKYENLERRLDIIEFLDIACAIGVDYKKIIEASFSR